MIHPSGSDGPAQQGAYSPDLCLDRVCLTTIYTFLLRLRPGPPERAGAFGSGRRRRIVCGPGISAAGKDEVMGRGGRELEGVHMKKDAGVRRRITCGPDISAAGKDEAMGRRLRGTRGRTYEEGRRGGACGHIFRAVDCLYASTGPRLFRRG